jgi:hypothetical protein
MIFGAMINFVGAPREHFAVARHWRAMMAIEVRPMDRNGGIRRTEIDLHRMGLPLPIVARRVADHKRIAASDRPIDLPEGPGNRATTDFVMVTGLRAEDRHSPINWAAHPGAIASTSDRAANVPMGPCQMSLRG